MIDKGRLSSSVRMWENAHGQMVGVCSDCPKVIVLGERHTREPNTRPRYDRSGKMIEMVLHE